MFVKCRILHVITREEAGDFEKLIKVLFDTEVMTRILKIESMQGASKSEIRFVQSLPYNTVICERIEDQNEKYICLPFFSSNFQVSVKTGEHVWVYPYKDNFHTSPLNVNGYWLCRPHGLNFAEDSIYTYSDREYVNNPFIESTILSDIFSNIKNSEGYSRNINDLDQFIEYKSSIIPEKNYVNNSEDTTIKGSRNNIVNLGSHNDYAKIDIIAGFENNIKEYDFEDIRTYHIIDEESRKSEIKIYKGSPTVNSHVIANNHIQKQSNLRHFSSNKIVSLANGKTISPPFTSFSIKDKPSTYISLIQKEKNDNLYYNSIIESFSQETILEEEKNITGDYKNSYTKFTLKTKNRPEDFLSLIKAKCDSFEIHTDNLYVGNKNNNITLEKNAFRVNKDNFVVNSDLVVLGSNISRKYKSVRGEILITQISALIDTNIKLIELLEAAYKDMKSHTHDIVIQPQPLLGQAGPIPVTGTTVSTPQQTLGPVIASSNIYSKTEKDVGGDSLIYKNLNDIKTNLNSILSQTVYIS